MRKKIDRTAAVVGRVFDGEILPPGRKTSGRKISGRKTLATVQPVADKTRTISTQEQAKKAGPGVHKVTSVVGLYLKIGETGSGSYFFRYRWGDKRREIGLGSRDRVELAEAREAAKDHDADRRKGIDPVDKKHRVRAELLEKQRASGTASGAVTFEETTMRFLKAHAGEWKHEYARATWLNPLATYGFPTLARLGVDQITVEHVLRVIVACEDAGLKETARRVRARIERVLRFAAAKGLRSATLRNPADSKLIAEEHPMKRRGEPPHFRAVDLDHAPKVFQELKARAATSSAFAAWCFMALTAARPSEALNARWNEVDVDKRLWTLPASRMKSAREHTVPLSGAACEILSRQWSVRTGDAVFPGRGGSPISYSNFAAAPKEAGLDVATAHGWRSVFRDWAGDIGDVPRELAETALAHSLGSVEASYRRRTAVEKRRDVMENYSRWLNPESAVVLDFPISRTALRLD